MNFVFLFRICTTEMLYKVGNLLHFFPNDIPFVSHKGTKNTKGLSVFWTPL